MKKILSPILLLLGGVAASWAIVAHRPVIATQAPVVEPPLVSVIRANTQSVRLNVRSQGVVAPREEIDWAAEAAGKIVRVNRNFVTGGFFRAGEELLAIDPRDYDQAVTAAQAAVAEARRQVAQEEAQAEQAHSEWRALGEGQPSPLSLHQPQLAEARAKLKAAEADLARARLQRSRCELRAPFAGRVLSREAGLGHYVQPGEKLARLYSTDVAEVRLPIATDQLAYLNLDLGWLDASAGAGPAVTLSAEIGGAEQRWQGRIVRSEGRLDEATGLLHVVAAVAEPYARHHGQPLLAGLFVRAEIEGRVRHDLYALPPAALNASQEALVVDGERRLHIRRLEVLRSEAGRILVKGGLNDGDLVVTEGVPVPVEGMKIRLAADGGTPEASGNAVP